MVYVDGNIVVAIACLGVGRQSYMRPSDFSTKKFEYLDHTADLGIRAYGLNIKDLFENAAEAMLSATAELDTIDETMLIEISVTETSLPELMRSWLDEINFRHEVDEMLFCRTEVREISNYKIRALVFGENHNRRKHNKLTEIKSVTFHQLQVEKITGGSWAAQVIFDI